MDISFRTCATNMEERVCGRCNDHSKTLKRCGRCKSIWYCSPECQRLDWKTHKEVCVPPSPNRAEPKRACIEAEQVLEERQCRYCLADDDDNDNRLVSPCECKGGQKWVHLECLRRWQRSSMVAQPTHPAFYTRDERMFICGVCKTEFNVKPLTRNELMAGFSGPEVVALVREGCLIVTEPNHNRELASLIMMNHLNPMVRDMLYWLDGVYLVTRQIPHLEEDEEDEEDQGSIWAVGMQRDVALEDFEGEARVLADSCEARLREAGNVEISHHIGGPVESDLMYGVTFLLAATTTDATGFGLTVVRDCGDQGVIVAGEVTNLSTALKDDVILDQSRPVLVFWGTGRWGKTQLLGEIARGSWGVTTAGFSDVFRKPDEESLYSGLIESGRLVFAPKNEMMREEVADSGTDSEAEEASAIAMIAQRDQLREQLAAQQERERARMNIIEESGDSSPSHLPDDEE